MLTGVRTVEELRRDAATQTPDGPPTWSAGKLQSTITYSLRAITPEMTNVTYRNGGDMLHTNEPSGPHPAVIAAQTPNTPEYRGPRGPNVGAEWTVQMRSNSAHFSSCCLNDASLPLANI